MAKKLDVDEMHTTYTFKMTRKGASYDDATYPDQCVEIKLGEADEMTLTVLLSYVDDFIKACGYITHGPLEYTEMEAERLMERLKRPERVKDSTG